MKPETEFKQGLEILPSLNGQFNLIGSLNKKLGYKTNRALSVLKFRHLKLSSNNVLGELEDALRPGGCDRGPGLLETTKIRVFSICLDILVIEIPCGSGGLVRLQGSVV